MISASKSSLKKEAESKNFLRAWAFLRRLLKIAEFDDDILLRALRISTPIMYVIVNAQAEGFMAINLPTPRAQPEGEVWFIAVKPEALGINYCISHLIGSLLAHGGG